MISPSTAELLRTSIHSSRESSVSSQRRLVNINWVRDLDRSGLMYGLREKQFLVTTTRAGERLYMQFPGKESVLSGSRKTARPWDFRPKVQFADSSFYEVDLSFRHIWDILLTVIDGLPAGNEDAVRALAAVFYRMAYMSDHVLSSDNPVFETRLLNLEYELHSDPSPFRQDLFPPFYIYSPPPLLLEELSGLFGRFGNMSFEAFLLYNDLLAWNEDCKYFHRSQEKDPAKWMSGIGRVNNLLTHVSVLGFKLGCVKLSEMLMRFIRNVGVSPASRSELRAILGTILSEGPDA